MCVYCKKEGAKNKREEAQKRALSANPKKPPLVTETTAEDVCPGSTLIETNTTLLTEAITEDFGILLSEDDVINSSTGNMDTVFQKPH